MNNYIEDKVSKALHEMIDNAIEKALHDNQTLTDEEKILDENLKKLQYEVAKKHGLLIIDPKKDIKPLTYETFHEFYGDDYYNFGRGQKLRPYKKDEIYVRYDNEHLNESKQTYPKPQKIETVIDKLRYISVTEDNIAIPNIKDSNDIPGYVLIILASGHMQKGHLEMIQKTMEVLGYFQANPLPEYRSNYPKFGNIEIYQFEPYYYKGYKLTINDQLLHVSPLCNKESILKNGFIASCKNKRFQYPPRNYFFNRFIKGSVYSLFYDGEVFRENKGRNEYVKFFMDTNKLMEAGIKFYTDPMFMSECAVYTYEENISSSYIKNVEHDLI